MPYSPSLATPRELLDAAKAAALRIIANPNAHLRWQLDECHVLALICFGPQEQAEWFEFAAQHAALRRELHCHPTQPLLPVLCPWSIAGYALRRAIEHIDPPVIPPKDMESEFFYWASIAGRACEPDKAANALVSQHLDACSPDDWRRYHLLLLYFRTLSDEARERALANGELLRYLDSEGWRALHYSGCGDLPWNRLPRDFDLVVNRVGVEVAGSLFAEAGHTDELRLWGELIFAKASQLLNEPPPPRQFWNRTVRFVDASRRTVSTQCEGTAIPEDTPPPPLRPKRGYIGFLEAERTREQREASENHGIQLWLEDMRRLETMPEGVLHNFDGIHALTGFRDLDPGRFQTLAENLLAAVVKKPVETYHLDGFVHAAAIVLMPLAPDHAAAITRELSDGHFRSACLNGHGVATAEAAAWTAAKAGNARCAEFCRDALRAAASDKLLMNLAITAQAEGAGSLLAFWCEEWLASSLAKERCLAVSLLPWLLDGDAGQRLAALVRDDPSGWVREHARWAGEVARQEAASRQQYRRVLEQSDANAARTLLTVLRPALTPAACWWRTTMPFAPDAGRVEVLAAITLFWERTNCTQQSSVELYGRKLEEHLRGEKIADLRGPIPRLN